MGRHRRRRRRRRRRRDPDLYEVIPTEHHQ